MATGRPLGLARGKMSAIPHLDAGSADARTGDHLAGVVDNALVVLILSMREVHAN